MDYIICGLFVLFCTFLSQFIYKSIVFAAKSATGTSSIPPTATNVTSTPAASVTKIANLSSTTPSHPGPSSTKTTPTTTPVTTTTPKPVNCSIGTCTGEECDNTTHTDTYKHDMCDSGKCVTQKHENGTLTYRCAEKTDTCETNTVTLTCCDTVGCNTHAAYTQEITKLGKKNGASTVTVQLYLLSLGIVSLRLTLM